MRGVNDQRWLLKVLSSTSLDLPSLVVHQHIGADGVSQEAIDQDHAFFVAAGVPGRPMSGVSSRFSCGSAPPSLYC